jgi:hypothetical protein
MYRGRGKLAKLNYMDIKQMLDRQIVQNEKGTLTDGEIRSLVRAWQDQRTENKLNSTTVEMELKAMEKKLQTYNVEQLGDIPVEREDRTIRIMVCQMGGCVSKESREFKIADTERLIRKYNINLCIFMKLNFNWTTVNSSANLVSWFHEEERNLRLVKSHTAHRR